MKHILILFAAALLTLTTACATSGGSHGSGGMMGLDDEPAEAVWADWTPRPANALAPKDFVDSVVAFDYWQIGDADFVEQAWTGASAVIDYARREGLSDKQDKAATLLLQALDSGESPKGLRMDVTYVVALDAQQPVEGLVVRLFTELPDKGVAPGLAIYLGRAEGAAGGFDRAMVWAQPGFRQTEAFTLSLENTDIGWVAHKFAGTVYPPREVAKPSLDGAADLASEIFAQRFWQPLVHANYVEGKPIADEQQALPKGIEAALGLEVRERQIEEVYRDTVFPPRAEVPPMGGVGLP